MLTEFVMHNYIPKIDNNIISIESCRTDRIGNDKCISAWIQMKHYRPKLKKRVLSTCKCLWNARQNYNSNRTYKDLTASLDRE